ncbi:Deoxycytidine monophosphate (dCMP) deaminase [Elasticomyces elasticus]|nr:Deoxycytidine monophosphate (dCMP) deaminase [Elasticomyces elasticus]
MLIGICGGICAGKHSIQNYLVERHGFESLELARETVPSVEKSASQTEVPRSQGTAAPRPPFASVNDLVEFTTANWQKNFCTTSIHSEAVVEALCHRPFFVLIHVDGPISIRWQRFKDRCTQASMTPPTLEQFVLRNDEHLYNAANGLASLASRAQVKLLNSTTSLSMLHAALDALNLTDPSRMRPTWDHYFMTLASLAARRSNCMRRQVGCVLVRSNRVISTGYNGTPRNVKNCNDGGCPRCNDGGGRSGVGLSTCLCLHAEENALLEAGRERVGGGAVLYCNTCPCLTCSIKIVQVGITEVVFNQSYYMDAEAAKIFNEAGVKLRQFSPPKEGLVVLTDEALVGRPGRDACGSAAGVGEPTSEQRSNGVPQAQATRIESGKASKSTETASEASEPRRTVDARASPSDQAQGQPAAIAPTQHISWQGQNPYRTTYAQLTPEQKGAFSDWRRMDPTSKVSTFLKQHQMIQMWGNDGASMIWGQPHSEGRLPNIIYGPGTFDWFSSPAQPGRPPPMPNPVYPEPPAHVLTEQGRKALISVQPYTVTAVPINGSATERVVAKRPAAGAVDVRAIKRHRGGAPLQSPVLNVNDPLANVSRVAQEVYKVMVTTLNRVDYLRKGVDEWTVHFYTGMEADEIKLACEELVSIELIRRPGGVGDEYIPVPLKTWQQGNEKQVTHSILNASSAAAHGHMIQTQSAIQAPGFWGHSTPNGILAPLQGSLDVMRQLAALQGELQNIQTRYSQVCADAPLL